MPRRLTKKHRRWLMQAAALLVVAASVASIGVYLGNREARVFTWTNPYGAVSSINLIENAANYDGERLTFAGEAVGERMVRGSGAWLHLNDDPYISTPVPAGGNLAGYNTGLPVWVPAAGRTDIIEHYGNYGTRGDIVEVTGTFYAASSDHGGDMVIVAESVRVVRSGRPIEHTVDLWKWVAAPVLLVVAAVMYAATKRRELRERIGHFKAVRRRS